MNAVPHSLRFIIVVLFSFVLAAPVAAQTCYTSADMDQATLQAVQGAAQQYFTMAQQGNYAGLKSAAIPALANSFDAVNGAIGEHQKDLQGQPQVTGCR